MNVVHIFWEVSSEEEAYPFLCSSCRCNNWNERRYLEHHVMLVIEATHDTETGEKLGS